MTANQTQIESNLKKWRDFQKKNNSLLGSSLPHFNQYYFLTNLAAQVKSWFKSDMSFLSYQNGRLTDKFKNVLRQRILQGEPNQGKILITAGAQAALFDILSLLGADASSILVEQYNYVGLYHLFKRFSLELKACPNFHCLAEDEIAHFISTTKPQLLYIQTDNSNPTGISLDLPKRKLLVELADKHDFYLIEDQAYRYLTPSEKIKPSLFELDLAGRTIAFGSLSKLFYPALRTGWVQANPNIIKRLAHIKEVRSLSHSNLLIRFGLELIKQRQLLKKNINLYHEKMKITLSFFEDLDRVRVVRKPAGGYFLWVEIKQLTQNEKSRLDLLIPNGQIFNYSQQSQGDYYRIGLGRIATKEVEPSLIKIRQIIN